MTRIIPFRPDILSANRLSREQEKEMTDVTISKGLVRHLREVSQTTTGYTDAGGMMLEMADTLEAWAESQEEEIARESRV